MELFNKRKEGTKAHDTAPSPKTKWISVHVPEKRPRNEYFLFYLFYFFDLVCL